MAHEGLAPHLIKLRLTEALLAGLLPDESKDKWHISPWPYAMVGLDPRADIHKSIAVGVGDTALFGSRPVVNHEPGLTLRTRAETSMSIRYMWALCFDSLDADIDLAIQAESDLMVALGQHFNAIDIGPYTPDRVTRRTQGEYHLTQIDLTFRHMYRIT